MEKNKEQIIRNDLNDLLDNNETLEYVMYGQLAPQMKRIVLIFALWLILIMLVLFTILPIGIYLIPVILILSLVSYLFFYETVYLGKFGKHIYIHTFDKWKIKSKKEKILLRNAFVVKDRTSDFHLTILVNIDGNNQYLIFKRNSDYKGYPNQSTNIKKLILDIEKKHKK